MPNYVFWRYKVYADIRGVFQFFMKISVRPTYTGAIWGSDYLFEILKIAYIMTWTIPV